MKKPKTSISTVDILRRLQEDVNEIVFEKLADDGHTMLISKPDVMGIIKDWIEYALEERIK